MSSDAPKKEDLFEYTEEQLLEEEVLTHYQILGIADHIGTEGVKKAYRKASLRYHPDKTGRGDDDYVFLAVKKAYDVLSDHEKRSAYDSTKLQFDDSIPPPRSQLVEDPLLLYKDEDFYDLFGPVFQRNMRFDANLRPDAPGVVKKKKQQGNVRGSNRDSVGKGFQPPTLGDDDTPIEEVHKFYEYWIHFESWRDFTAQATEELQVENELENAESRFEKRWLQKEVDKRAKQFKTKENGRIQTLVERAMEADPRLRRERQALQEAKEQAKADRAAAAERKKQEEEEARLEAERAAEEEKQRKAEEKVAREQEKKLIRKERQQLRKMTSSSFEETPVIWADAYDMNLDVDYLCSSLNLDELKGLNDQFEQSDKGEAALSLVRDRASQKREAEKTESAAAAAAGPTESSLQQSSKESSSNKPKPWTKDELSALAKGVKKYPPGGASRWDQITLFVNNLCKQDNPRSREECIQKYNDVTKSNKAPPATQTPAPSAAASTSTTTPSTAPATSTPPPATSSSSSSTTTKPTTTNGTKANAQPASPAKAANGSSSNGNNNGSNTTATTAAAGGEDVWTAAQDQELQSALAKFPASMEKNARWAAIADAVPGKSKKQCVQRFKAIREALKNRK